MASAGTLNSNLDIYFNFFNAKGNKNIKSTKTELTKLNKNVGDTSKNFNKAENSMNKAEKAGIRFRVTTSGMKEKLGALRNELLVLAFAFGGIVAAVRKSIQAVVELEAALLGLGAVAEKTGNSKFKAMAEATKLASTGLISVKEASAGLKNLLSTGQFTLQQSVDIMHALGDAAAFNRQGTLSYGEAVIGATQGIKNQNCLSYYNTILYVEENDSSCNNDINLVSSPIGELHDDGKVPAVFSVDRDSGNIVNLQSSYIHYNGEKDVFKITLENGSEVESTDNHRFLTKSGFKFLSELNEGEEVYWVDESKLREKICELLNTEKENAQVVNNYSAQQTQHKKYVKNAYKSDVKSVIKYLQSNLGKDYQQQSSVQEDVKESGTVKIEKEKNLQIIDRETILKKFGLSAKFAEKILDHLESMSIKDLEEFVLINADQLSNQVQGKNNLAKMSGKLLILLKNLVIGVDKRSKTSQAELIKEDSVQISVEQSGKNQKQKDGQQRNILLPLEKHQKGKNMQKITTTGEQQSFQGIPFDVHDAVEMVKEVLRLIIYSVDQNSQNYRSSYQMVSRSARTATEKSIKKVNKILKKLKISPTLIKIVSISYQGIKPTFDLTVPDDHNYLAGSFVTHNSIMTDNAGITKNLSIMYEEYAAQIGTTAGKLSEAQKYQAIYNGMLKEASIFAGNASLVTETLSGVQSKLNVTMFNTRAAIGGLISGGYKLMLNSIQDMVKSISNWVKANEDVLKQKIGDFLRKVNAVMKTTIHAIQLIVKGMGKIISAIPGFSMFVKIWFSLFAISKLTVIFSALLAKISLLTAAYKTAAVSSAIFNKAVMANTVTMTGMFAGAIGSALASLTMLGMKLPIIGKLFNGLYLIVLRFNSILLLTEGRIKAVGLAMKASMPYLIALSAAILVGIALWKRYKQNSAETALDIINKKKEELKATQDVVERLRDNNSEVKKLGNRYKELITTTDLSKKGLQEIEKIEDRLNQLQPELNLNIGNTAENIGKIGEAIDKASPKIHELNTRLENMNLAMLSLNISMEEFKVGAALDTANKKFDEFIKKGLTATSFGANNLKSIYGELVKQILNVDSVNLDLIKSFDLTDKNINGYISSIEGLIIKYQDLSTNENIAATEREGHKIALSALQSLYRSLGTASTKTLDDMKSKWQDLKNIKPKNIVNTMISDIEEIIKEAKYSGKTRIDIQIGEEGQRETIKTDVRNYVNKVNEVFADIMKQTGDKPALFGASFKLPEGNMKELQANISKLKTAIGKEDIPKLGKDLEALFVPINKNMKLTNAETLKLTKALSSIQKDYESLVKASDTVAKNVFKQTKDMDKLAAKGKAIADHNKNRAVQEAIVTNLLQKRETIATKMLGDINNLEAGREKKELGILRTYQEQSDALQANMRVVAEMHNLGVITNEQAEGLLQKSVRQLDVTKKWRDLMLEMAKTNVDKVWSRLSKSIDTFVRSGVKAQAETAGNMWDKIFGTDSASSSDRIQKAKDTKRQLISNLQRWAKDNEEYSVLAKIREKEINDAYNKIIINETKKFYEERLNTMVSYMEKLVGGFAQLGAFLADHSAGVSKEMQKRMTEVDKMFKDEVITFEEKEKQMTAIKRAASDERLKMEKKFWFNMVKVVTDSVGKILQQYAIESAAKAMANASAGNSKIGIGGLLGAIPGIGWGALALGVGIPLIGGFLSRRNEIGQEDKGFAGLDSANRAGSSGADQDRLTGAITARELQIVLAPSIQIEGEIIAIGQIGVEELRQTLGQVSVKAIQDALENKELDLSRIS